MTSGLAGDSGFNFSSLFELDSESFEGGSTIFSFFEELLDELLLFLDFFLLELDESESLDFFFGDEGTSAFGELGLGGTGSVLGSIGSFPDDDDESDFGLTTGGNFSDSLELLDDLGFEGSVTGGFSGIDGESVGLLLSDFFFSLPSLELDESAGFSGSVGGSTGVTFLSDFLLDELLGDSNEGIFTPLTELESDFLSAGLTSVGFSADFFFEELEDDDELFDFFFSMSGIFSDSLELSEDSTFGTGLSLGSDLGDSELEEDFFRSGDLIGDFGSTFSFGDSGFLSSLSSELESLDDFLGITGSTGAGCIGEGGLTGTDSFLDDSDEELLDFFFSTGGSFSDSLEELEEDFGFDGSAGGDIGFTGSV